MDDKCKNIIEVISSLFGKTNVTVATKYKTSNGWSPYDSRAAAYYHNAIGIVIRTSSTHFVTSSQSFKTKTSKTIKAHIGSQASMIFPNFNSDKTALTSTMFFEANMKAMWATLAITSKIEKSI
jgi:hypothetical protein